MASTVRTKLTKNRRFRNPGEGTRHPFEIDAFRKEMLLTGRDEIELTLDSEARIREFEERHAGLMAWALPAPR